MLCMPGGKYFLEKSSAALNFSAAMFMSYKDCSERLFEMYNSDFA